jgi:uncharacterized protein (TIGR01777 family)
MNIGIFGSNGFIGKHLATFLANDNNVKCFTRIDLAQDSEMLAVQIEGLDVIINLVGAPVLDKRWTSLYKKIILESRLNALEKLCKAVFLAKTKPRLLISASAIGIYKTGIYVDEDTESYSDDFLASVVKKWESKAFELEKCFSKVIVLRFGIVLGKSGGALKSMINIYKWGIGIIPGSPSSVYPFISVNDLLRAISFLIENKVESGVYNLVEPVKTSNQEFSDGLKMAMDTKYAIGVPAGLFKLFLGKRADVLLAGQYVYPKKLVNLGFQFQDSDIAEFLKKEIN